MYRCKQLAAGRFHQGANVVGKPETESFIGMSSIRDVLDDLSSKMFITKSFISPFATLMAGWGSEH